ncbi:MAG: VWA domain-containing protein [Planctomycetaceae bacterium]
MLSNFLNPLMLLGLAGLLLPVLVHLLSRRRYDVVEWGAMQFLELGRHTRRRMKLEQLLLMLLRMGLVALVVLAMARPWARGGLFSGFASTQSRDVVLVVDGSYSMGWEGDGVTPHAQAVGWAHKLLEDLGPGDTVALIDAREQPHAVIETLTHNFAAVRQQLNQLPSPAGTVNLPASLSHAARILNQATNVSREIIVLSDGQARGWSADDIAQWTRFDVLSEDARVRPSVWVVNVNKSTEAPANFALERLRLSRDVTVAAFPLHVHTRVAYAGAGEAATRSVFFEVDGQRLNDQTIQVKLEPGQEADVEFEHRFNAAGSHVVSVVLEDDNLPADNRADAVVTVAEAISLLLVDGSPHPDATQRETYFASAALTAKANETPWVRATVITAEQVDTARLAGADVAVLANVARLTETQAGMLEEFISRGGGLLVAPGDRVDAPAYNTLLYRDGAGLLPASLDAITKAEAASRGTSVKDGSLEAAWLRPFRAENDGGLTSARFSHWWKVVPAEAHVKEGPRSKTASTTVLPSPPAGLRRAQPSGEGQGGGKVATRRRGDAETRGRNAEAARPEPRPPGSAAPLVAARFENDDPFLISSRYKRGRVILMTAPLDADWSTLPAKPDYVSLLHEMVFHLVAGRSDRNVDVGTLLVLPIAANVNVGDSAFFGPDDAMHEAVRMGDEPDAPVAFADTRLPGLYRFDKKPDVRDAAVASRPELFAVDCDRRESDLRPLDDRERETLAGRGRMTFINSDEQLKQEMLASDNKAEYWHVLMLAFVGILVGEVALTRRLVKGGHAVVDESPTAVAAGP